MRFAWFRRGQIGAAHMASQRATGDAQALAVLHDMLRYVERELHFLDAPAHDAAASVGKAATTVKATLRERSAKRRSPSRR